MDIRINLIALGALIELPDGRERFLCHCHRNIHDGKIKALVVLSIVALREGTTPEIITECVDLFRRLLKPSPVELQRGLEELTPLARLLALRELAEAPVKRRPLLK